MREAFTYMFKDTMFGKKAFSYWFLCFIVLLLAGAPDVFKTAFVTQTPTVTPVPNPLLNILLLIAVLLYAILGGYYFAGVKAIAEQKDNIVLPLINPWKNFVKGVKFGIAQATPVVILFAILYPLVISLGSRVMGLAYILVIIFCSFYFINSNIFYLLYANESKIFTYFRWKKACEMLKSANKKVYFKNLFLVIFVNILGGLLSSLFNYIFNSLIANTYTTWVLTSIEGAILGSFTAFVTMYLVAKSVEFKTVV